MYTLTEEDFDDLDEAFAHYGIPGMRWGKRKAAGSGPDPKAKKATTPPGKAAAKPKPKSDPNDLSKISDADLRQKINRIQMEKQFAQLTAKEKSVGKKVVGEILASAGKEIAKDYTKKYAKQGLEMLGSQLMKQVVKK